MDQKFKEKFISLIPYGSENGVPMKILADVFEIPDRQIRKIVELLRKDNVPICGDSNGYYFAVSLEEEREYINLVRSRFQSTWAVYQTHDRHLKKMMEAEKAHDSANRL